MSMMYSKIKVEIGINNDELLETIWKFMQEIKWGEGEVGNIIELINLHLLTIIFTLFSRFQNEVEIKI
jgi:hypothetical protein